MVDRILVYSQRASAVWKHMSADMAHGFRKLGTDVQFVEELHNEPKEMITESISLYWRDIVRCQLEFKPEVIFQMGHLRFAYPHGMWSGNAIHVTWVQDWHHWIIGVEAAWAISNADQVRLFNASKDWIFYSFPALGEAIIKQGYCKERVRFLPPGVNEDRFYWDGNGNYIRRKFEIGFPCNVGAPMTSGDPIRLAHRLDPVRWLIEAGECVKLWGKGWDAYDWATPHWLGEVKNGPELRRAYGECQAILQSNTDTGFHQRVYEAIRCQAWVLRRKVDDCQEMTGVSEFSTKDELLDLVACRKRSGGLMFYEDFQTDLIRDHSYTSRCQDILNAVHNL